MGSTKKLITPAEALGIIRDAFDHADLETVERIKRTILGAMILLECGFATITLGDEAQALEGLEVAYRDLKKGLVKRCEHARNALAASKANTDVAH